MSDELGKDGKPFELTLKEDWFKKREPLEYRIIGGEKLINQIHDLIAEDVARE